MKAAQLRPGDVIEVRTHEVVPADARLIEEEDLEVDESTLTGESLPVEKQVESTPGADLAERRCMLYGGTTIVAGTAVALVTAVGADTQARRAAELVSSELPPDRTRTSAQPTDQPGLPGQRDRRATGQWPWPVAQQGYPSGRVQWDRDHGGGGAGGDAAGGDARTGGLGATADELRCAGSRPAIGGGAGPHRRGVLRQDRDAVRKPPAGIASASRGELFTRRRVALRGARRTRRQRRTAGARDRPRDHRGRARRSTARTRRPTPTRIYRSGRAGRSRRRCSATS